MTNSPSSPIEPLLDLRGLAAGILWRRRLWCSVALLGVLAGALATLLLPPTPTAVTRVLIVREDETNNRETLMATDVALFDTAATAAAALHELNVDERPEDFLDDFDGEALTANLLQITARGNSDADAVRRAHALADAFIAGHVRRSREAAEAQAQALLDRQAGLEREYAEVSDEIPTASGERREALFQRRASLAAQIVDLGQRSQEAFIGAPRVEAGTQIVDPPRAIPTSLMMSGVTNVAVGLVFGLAAGLSLAALQCVTRDRPVVRRDIAAHLGVSVIVAVPAVHRVRARNRGRRAREHKRAATALAHIVRDTPGSVSLLEIGCPRTAAALALAMADRLAATDRPVTVVDHLAGGHLRKKRGRVGDRVQIVDIAELRPEAASPAESGPPVERRELRLDVGPAGPGTSWADLDRLTSPAILVVRAGHASTLWLHTVARLLADAGIFAIGVVLVQPYPRDATDGTLWDEFHAALRAQRPTDETPRLSGSRPVPSRNGSAPPALDSPTEEMRLP